MNSIELPLSMTITNFPKQIVYLVRIKPLRSNRQNYTLGVYSSREAATMAGKAATAKADRGWWSEYFVTEHEVKQ